MGGRYFVITMGGLTLVMWATRFIFFTIYESPKYLMGKGKDEEAVAVFQEIASRNKRISSLTVQDLKACEDLVGGASVDISAGIALKRQLREFNLTHVRALFSTSRLAFSTALIMIVWGFIGLAYPLYITLFFLTFRQRVGLIMATAPPTLLTATASLLLSWGFRARFWEVSWWR